MKWWDQMPWSQFFKCWVLSQLFHSPLSLSSRGSLAPLAYPVSPQHSLGHLGSIWLHACLVAQSCPTVCNLWTVALDQAPLSMRFFRQEHWCGLPFPPPGNLLNPGIKSVSPALHINSLPTESLGKPTLWLLLLSCFSHVRLYVTP